MSRTRDSRTNYTIDRRNFLLTLGAGVPLLAQGCTDEAGTEQFRDLQPDAPVEFEGPLGKIDNPPPLEADAVNLSAQVIRAASKQAIIGDEQACSIPTAFANHLFVGDQVRIIRNSKEYALYTVAETRQTDNPDKVRLGLDARLRLGTSNEFGATLRMPVVAEGLTDAQAKAKSEFVERLVDDGINTGLVAIAPHGGIIEINTDFQAERVTTNLADYATSSWICKGWREGGGGYERWHITSTAISPRSFPRLGIIANRGFAYAVSFHGMSSGGVLIGGAGPLELKQMLREAIEEAIGDSSVAVTIASSTDQFNGDSEKNVVNWLTLGGGGGIQIEQGRNVRLDYWREIADAVSSVFELLL